MKSTHNKYGSFIFTHIPKCGGTSFRHYINDSSIKSGIVPKEIYIPGCNNIPYNKNLNQLNEKEIIALNNSEIKILANHSKFEEHRQLGIKMSNPFYYTILRDPIERFISHYNFFYFKNGIDNLKGISLNDLGSEELERLISSLSNLQVKYLSNTKFPKAIGIENQYKIAFYNLTQVYGCFGILELIQQSIQQLKQKLPGWILLEEHFPSLNSYKKENTISSEIIALIKAHNHFDIMLYNKAADIFNDRNLAQ